MCGITGFIDYKKTSDEQVLRLMAKCLSHRGPDDEGYHVVDLPSARIGVGHKRLSIIDLTPSGHQPMHFEDWTIVFNGEVYNYQEVRQELEAVGYQFNSTSDTAVILRAFDYWGVKAIEKFVGMFAFFISNKKTEKAYLFRDRVGVKPVYYYSYATGFIFGSELKSLMKHPLFKKDLNMSALGLYFQYGYIPSPFSIFENAKKLQPGHYLEIDLKNRKISDFTYWNVTDYFSAPKLEISETEAAKLLEEKLRVACEYRMVSDVPVGLFLSGGYDSSMIAAMLQRGRAEKIKTFTIGFENKLYDESVHARKIATFLGTDHTEHICSEMEAKEIIPTLTDYFDEPFGDSSAIPTILVSKVARKAVTVALSADGGDEIFGGYTRYEKALKNFNRLNTVPVVFQRAIGGLMKIVSAERSAIVRSRFRGPHFHFALQKLFSEGVSIGKLYDMACQYLNEKELKELLKLPYSTILSNSYNRAGYDSLTRMIVKDLNTYLPDDILVKVDRATMSVSIEGREPLLDHNLIEFMAKLPSDFKIKNGQKKYLFKQLTHQYIPKELLDRPKQGFALPLHDWMRKELKNIFEHYLNGDLIRSQNLFNTSFIQEKKEEFYRGKNDHFEFLWFMLMFQMWYKKWME